MGKYKVLIADDEEMIRKGLESLVVKDPDMEVVALAEDGEIALDLAKKTKPDLILADINMPFMTGLQFVEELLKVEPNVTVVIVTGYDDFEYVQKALQLGAKDYILKPIMEEPFYELLNKMKRLMSSKIESAKYIDWAQKQIEKNKRSLIEKLMNDWVYGEPDESEVKEKMKYLGITIPDSWTLTLINIKETADSKLEEDLLYFATTNIAEEVMAEKGKLISFISKTGILSIISDYIPDRDMEELKPRLVSTLESVLDVKATVGNKSGIEFKDIPNDFLILEEDLKKTSEHSSLVKQALYLIEREYMREDLTLIGIADELHVSSAYIGRLIKAETGGTFGEHLSNLRVKVAMKMLKDPNVKIYEISEKCGYASQHYFSCAFKKNIGMSPMEYRKGVLGIND